MNLVTFSEQSVQLFSTDKHADLRFHIETSFNYAREWPSVTIHHREAALLAGDLPLLFLRDGSGRLHLVVLLHDTKSSPINPQGRWVLKYTPAKLRFYPFTWVKQGSESKLAVYHNAPHFKGKGEKLVTSRHKPTQRMRSILSHLQPVQAAFDETALLLEELKGLDLLKPMGLTFKAGDKQQQLNALIVDKVLYKQHRTISPRLRRLLHLHLQSLSPLMAVLEQNSVPEEPTLEAVAASGDMSGAVELLLMDACRKYSVTADELKSRKRHDDINKARQYLAQESESQGILSDMAAHLSRQPATLKRWLSDAS
ncbi:SapC family protein [Nitrincola alkalilacustris]|uniref:SapC family protein n=1 Tax=Nitrincola alkalilacustris TaxID=1571224 RepID=UPI00124C95AD|nr:SapC family protein [Nitrincola alkalilacustris]